MLTADFMEFVNIGVLGSTEKSHSEILQSKIQPFPAVGGPVVGREGC